MRLASKLCGWDIEIMTREELDEQIEKAVGGFCEIDGMDENLAEKLVGEGFLSYDDLSVIEPDALMEMGGLTEEQVNHIVAQAEAKAEEAEAAASEERRRQREQQRIDAATAALEAQEAAERAAQGLPPLPPPGEPVAEGDVAESDGDAVEGDELADEASATTASAEGAEAQAAGEESGNPG